MTGFSLPINKKIRISLIILAAVVFMVLLTALRENNHENNMDKQGKNNVDNTSEKVKIDTNPEKVEKKIEDKTGTGKGDLNKKIIEADKNDNNQTTWFDVGISSMKNRADIVIEKLMKVDRSGISSCANLGPGKDKRIVTFADSELIPFLREWIGMIHNTRENENDVPHVVVIGYNLAKIDSHEIQLWKNVILLNLEDILERPLSELMKSSNSPFQGLVRLISFRYLLERFDGFVFLDVHWVTNQKILDKIISSDSMASFGFNQNENSWLVDSPLVVLNDNSMDLFINRPLQCLRGYQCPLSGLKELKESQLKSSCIIDPNSLGLSFTNVDKKEYLCYTLMRDEVIYDAHLSYSELGPIPQGKKRIGIGMPTMTVSGKKAQTVSPLKIFLPSLIKTVTDEEFNTFEFVIFIGYDENDILFGDDKSRIEIIQLMKNEIGNRPIRIVTVGFPFSKGWVTFIWNGLFVQAMNNDCEYFYQVNDDLQLTTSGWATDFVHELGKIGNVGIAGPGDPFHGPKSMLMTQSFAHRNHFSIFGRYFPIGIKDWYCDDWTSYVYGPERSMLLRKHQAKNINEQGSRYKACTKPKFEYYLNIGKEMIQNFNEKKQITVIQ